MNADDNPLRSVRIAAPCPANWESMCGNEQVRFCGQCNLNVYNLSGMTRPEAEAFVMRAEGRVCVRFFRRADGTMLTQNCPVGWRALKKRVSGVAKAAASAVMGFVAGLGFNIAFSGRGFDEPAGVMGAMIAASLLPDQSFVQLQGEMIKEPAFELGGMEVLPSPYTKPEKIR